VLDEVALVFGEFLPVLRILAQIDLVHGPEAGHLVLVHLPDVLVHDWQNYEAVRVLLQQGLRHGLLSQVLALARVGDRMVRYDLRISTAISAIVLLK
jgi:hypothetical protein